MEYPVQSFHGVEIVLTMGTTSVHHFNKVGVGILINIGSSAGFQPLPHMAVYSANQVFVQYFTLALAGECLEQSGIRVRLTDPSGVDMGFQSNAGVKKNPGE